jgi:hypothetical protein
VVTQVASGGSTSAKEVVHDEVWRAHDGNMGYCDDWARRRRFVVTGCGEGIRGEIWYLEAGAIGEKSTSLRAGLGAFQGLGARCSSGSESSFEGV